MPDVCSSSSRGVASRTHPAGGGPIYDNRIGQQLQAVGNMLRKNGGLRGDWAPVDGTARTRTSATYINLIDSRFDDELAETWFNSIFCGLFSHDLISEAACSFTPRGPRCAATNAARKPVPTCRR